MVTLVLGQPLVRGCRAGWDPSSSCSAFCGKPIHIYSFSLDVLCCRATLIVDMISPKSFPTFCAEHIQGCALSHLRRHPTFGNQWESGFIRFLWAFWNTLSAGLLLLQPPQPM